MPHDRPPSARSSGRGGSAGFTLDGPLVAALRELAARHGATLFMTLQAAVGALLACLGAGEDIPIGSPVTVRGDAAPGLIGPFASTVGLRVDVSGQPAFAQVLSRVRAFDAAALDVADVPFQRVVEAVRPRRGAGRNPLFQVMVVLAEPGEPDLTPPGLTGRAQDMESGTARFELVFTFHERADPPGGQELAGLIDFDADLFDLASAQRLARQLVRLLGWVAAHPGEPLHRFELLDRAARAAVVEEWNATARPVPAQDVVGLFAACVRAAPDAPALACGALRLSYAELAERASRLAGMLADHGVGPDAVVAVALPRSVDAVAAARARSGGTPIPAPTSRSPSRAGWPRSPARSRVTWRSAANPTPALADSPGAPE